MRIAIWCQFSSNNSSSYVIVGAFETPEKAVQAGSQFKALLRRIWEAYTAQADTRDAVLHEEGHEATEIERLLAHDYGIDFEQALEWVARQESPDFLSDAVASFENLLFVANITETVTSDTPLAQFMHKLGADVKFEEALQAYLMVTLTARAGDPDTALFIKSAAERYFRRDPNLFWQRPPWVLFYDGRLAPNLEQLSRDIDTYIAHYHAWRNWHQAHKVELDDLVARRDAAWRAKDNMSAATLTEQISALSSKQHEVEPRLADEANRNVHK